MNESGGQTGYVLGHSERELKRLEAQAGFYEEATRDALLKAGIAPGMRVLDLGTGVGDVALIAAEIVGTKGAVTASTFPTARSQSPEPAPRRRASRRRSRRPESTASRALPISTPWSAVSSSSTSQTLPQWCAQWPQR